MGLTIDDTRQAHNNNNREHRTTHPPSQQTSHHNNSDPISNTIQPAPTLPNPLHHTPTTTTTTLRPHNINNNKRPTLPPSSKNPNVRTSNQLPHHSNNIRDTIQPTALAPPAPPQSDTTTQPFVINNNKQSVPPPPTTFKPLTLKERPSHQPQNHNFNNIIQPTTLPNSLPDTTIPTTTTTTTTTQPYDNINNNKPSAPPPTHFKITRERRQSYQPINPHATHSTTKREMKTSSHSHSVPYSSNDTERQMATTQPPSFKIIKRSKLQDHSDPPSPSVSKKESHATNRSITKHVPSTFKLIKKQNSTVRMLPVATIIPDQPAYTTNPAKITFPDSNTTNPNKLGPIITHPSPIAKPWKKPFIRTIHNSKIISRNSQLTLQPLTTESSPTMSVQSNATTATTPRDLLASDKSFSPATTGTDNQSATPTKLPILNEGNKTTTKRAYTFPVSQKQEKLDTTDTSRVPNTRLVNLANDPELREYRVAMERAKGKSRTWMTQHLGADSYRESLRQAFRQESHNAFFLSKMAKLRKSPAYIVWPDRPVYADSAIEVDDSIDGDDEEGVIKLTVDTSGSRLTKKPTNEPPIRTSDESRKGVTTTLPTVPANTNTTTTGRNSFGSFSTEKATNDAISGDTGRKDTKKKSLRDGSDTRGGSGEGSGSTRERLSTCSKGSADQRHLSNSKSLANKDNDHPSHGSTEGVASNALPKQRKKLSVMIQDGREGGSFSSESDAGDQKIRKPHSNASFWTAAVGGVRIDSQHIGAPRRDPYQSSWSRDARRCYFSSGFIPHHQRLYMNPLTSNKQAAQGSANNTE